MRKDSLIKYKKWVLWSYLASIVVLFLLYPKIIAMNVNIKYLITWYVWSGLGAVYFNNKFLSIVENAKKGANIDDFFSATGRKKIRENPVRYLSDDDYKKYQNNFRYMLLFFGVTGVVLFVGTQFVIKTL